jgi:transposase
LIAPRAGVRVWIATKPVDFRKGVHSLTALVVQALRIDPYGGDIVVFRSKQSDRIKLLAWDGSGMVLATKLLECGRFV